MVDYSIYDDPSCLNATGFASTLLDVCSFSAGPGFTFQEQKFEVQYWTMHGCPGNPVGVSTGIVADQCVLNSLVNEGLFFANYTGWNNFAFEYRSGSGCDSPGPLNETCLDCCIDGPVGSFRVLPDIVG